MGNPLVRLFMAVARGAGNMVVLTLHVAFVLELADPEKLAYEKWETSREGRHAGSTRF
jgi:hypothetical protein